MHYTLQIARPQDGWAQLETLTIAARAAAEQMQREGIAVRFLRSVYVPEEDSCFFLYRAPSIELVRAAVGRAFLALEPGPGAVSESWAADLLKLGGSADSRPPQRSYRPLTTDANEKGARTP